MATWEDQHRLRKVALPLAGNKQRGKGEKLYRVPVRVWVNSSQLCSTIRKVEFRIIAKNAAIAANWARDRMQYLPETEIWAWGPKGGEVYRCVGWQTAVGAHMDAGWKGITDKDIMEGFEEVLGQRIEWTCTEDYLNLIKR